MLYFSSPILFADYICGLVLISYMEINCKESEYKWIEAAKLYEQKLASSLEDSSSVAKFLERVGYCYFMASRQADKIEKFKKLRMQAVEAYEKAGKF